MTGEHRASRGIRVLPVGACAATLALLAACSSPPVVAPSSSPAPPSTTVTTTAPPPDPTTTPVPTTTPAPTTSAPGPTTPPPSPTTPPETSPAPPAQGTVPPPWLGTRPLPTDPAKVERLQTPSDLVGRAFTLPDTVPMLPGDAFASRVVSPAPADVVARSTWHDGCPVAADELAWLRLTFHGFDGARHSGELLVNASVADDIVQVFSELWDAGVQLERTSITTSAEQDATPTGDGNDTVAYACRTVRGSKVTSQHAYGLAIDVNPFQNPYVKGDLVLPELARAYLDRGSDMPGIITRGDAVVRAFARIGWGWGGGWDGLKDYQHFSLRNR